MFARDEMPGIPRLCMRPICTHSAMSFAARSHHSTSCSNRSRFRSPNAGDPSPIAGAGWIQQCQTSPWPSASGPLKMGKFWALNIRIASVLAASPMDLANSASVRSRRMCSAAAPIDGSAQSVFGQ